MSLYGLSPRMVNLSLGQPSKSRNMMLGNCLRLRKHCCKLATIRGCMFVVFVVASVLYLLFSE
jgi:hypothetical protein